MNVPELPVLITVCPTAGCEDECTVADVEPAVVVIVVLMFVLPWLAIVTVPAVAKLPPPVVVNVWVDVLTDAIVRTPEIALEAPTPEPAVTAEPKIGTVP